ncbi:MAG: hypothetical protein GX020_08575 [Firmicutes bacterium]|jgi:large subunit ribosomal protein L14e|nr:hypothetical protein [Bacillota bacterium]
MGAISVGQFVSSRAGRDINKNYIVLRVIDESFVEVADGETRKVERPKRKNIKHLRLHKYINKELQQLLESDATITDQQVKDAIQLFLKMRDHGKEEGSTVDGKR